MAAVRMDRGQTTEIAVPSGAYYGVRTQRAAERVIRTGKSYKHDLLVALAALNKTTAHMEVETGRLDRRVGGLIAQAAQEIVSGRWHEQFVFEPDRCGSGERLTYNMNEVLANRALELYGEERGHYELISPDWHADRPLYPNRYFSAAFQLAALGYWQTVYDFVEGLPNGDPARGIQPKLRSLRDRLCRINGEQFDAKFAGRLAQATGYPFKHGAPARETYDTVYDQITSCMKLGMGCLEPALAQLDSVEMKAAFVQVSAFHDMVVFISRSGFSAQGMEEIAAYYSWCCLNLYYESLLRINRIYHSS